MRRLPTTVCCIVGATPAELDLLDGPTNVRVVRTAATGAGEDPLARATEAWRAVSGSSRRFTLHDADPLAAVATGWAELYDHHRRGSLEVAVAALKAAWRADAVDLPDYYLVMRADELTATLRHWYLGVLSTWAPARVIPAPSPASALAMLGRLPAARWWPPLAEVLAGIDELVPDALVPRATSS